MFCTAELAPRKNIVTKAIATTHPELARAPARRAGPRLRAARAQRAIAARDRTARAAHHRRTTVIARYRAEKDGAACSTTTT